MIRMKTCSKCKIEQLRDTFYKDKRRQDGLTAICKTCTIKTQKIYYKRKAEKIIEYQRKYRLDKQEKVKACKKKHYQKNAETIKAKSKKYYLINKDKVKDHNKKYRKEKALQIRETKKKYQKEKLKKDPLFKLSRNIRRSITRPFNKKGMKKYIRTEQILGCSFEEFRSHIESQFKEGMSWELMGKYIHIDHIIPVSLGNTEEEIIKLNHYTNLRPLWAEDNLKKGAKLI